jgi:Tat protein translocase TatB subunit
MNVFGVGPAELIVVLVVALVFVGPQRLPRLAADLARTIRDIRRYTGSIAAEFNDAIQELERQTEPERGEWKDIGRGLSEATQSVSGAFREAGDDASRAGDPAPSNGSQAPEARAANSPAEDRR